MTKFKVGDKVRVLDANKICENGTGRLTTGNEYEILSFHEKGGGSVEHIKVADNFSNPFTICDWEYKYIEIVETKPTKNQRITALENEVAELRPLKQEVAELKLIVHELRERPQLTTVINNAPQEPSTTDTVEDIIEFEGQKYRKVDREAREGDVVVFRVNDTNPNYSTVNKPYKVAEDFGDHVRFIGNNGEDYAVYTHDHNRRPETTDVYELIESKPLTPNQQRAEIIEKAKKFVEKYKNLGVGSDYHEVPFCKNVGHVSAKFYVNEKKNVVVAVVQSLYSEEKKHGNKGIAKCNPGDVFNEHIGKAIALGRALGLDVSEFEQAVQPTVAIGQLLDHKNNRHNHTRWKVDNLNDTGKNLTIIDNEFESLNGETADGGYLPNETWYKIIDDTNAIYGGVE